MLSNMGPPEEDEGDEGDVVMVRSPAEISGDDVGAAAERDDVSPVTIEVPRATCSQADRSYEERLLEIEQQKLEVQREILNVLRDYVYSQR